jgi:hypothetical protein
MTVGGWAIGRIAPARELQVLLDGALLHRTPVDRQRLDVADVFPAEPDAPSSGFRLRLGLLGLPPIADLELCIALADGSPLHIGTITVSHTPFEVGTPSRLSPVLVTSLGRMGTTWLMGLLGQHPEVVIHPQYPHELGVARYLAHLLAVICAPADHLDSSQPDTFSKNTKSIGHNPFFGDFLAADEETNNWLSCRAPALMAAFVRQATDEFYGSISSRSGRCGARFFGEKCLPDHLPYLFHDLYESTREVILVRDIRDVVCSALAFNAKRGTSSFGREWLDDDLAFVDQLHQDLERLVVSWRRRSGTALLVRYEDLVREPEATLARVFGHIGISSSPEIVNAALAGAQATSGLEAHRTTATGQESSGRWTTELAQNHPLLLQRCHERCGDLLLELGYDVPGAGRRAPELKRALGISLASLNPIKLPGSRAS